MFLKSVFVFYAEKLYLEATRPNLHLSTIWNAAFRTYETLTTSGYLLWSPYPAISAKVNLSPLDYFSTMFGNRVTDLISGEVYAAYASSIYIP